MDSRNRYHGMPPYAINTVRHYARRLARNPGIFPADVEDLEQELMLDLHRRLDRFNSAKASINTFIARVIENHAATILDSSRQEKNGKMVSLHELVQNDDGDAVELIDTITASQSPWATHALSWNESIDLQADVLRLLARLPPSLREIAQRLMEETVSELSASTSITRQAVYVAMGKIKSRFNKMESRKKSPTAFEFRRYVRGMEQWMGSST
jgi:RNA polymerase sigma-70 factor (ECF subfamily)